MSTQSEHVLEFKLVQKAKSSGGDKFVCTTNPEFNIYVPQSISRLASSEPQQVLSITIRY